MSEPMIDADIRTARTLPSQYYTDPSMFERLKTVFNGWQFAAHDAELKANTALPLAQVALECGFSDQAHFTKAFAKASGLTPAKWRRCQICAT